MKINKILGLTILTLGATAAITSAHMMEGGMNYSATELSKRFETEAKTFGVTVDEVKNYWSQDKSIIDLAKDKGFSTTTIESKMTELRSSEMKTKMQELVTSGVITQAQADQKLASMQTKMQNKMENKSSKGGNKMGMRGEGKRN
jgi:hypothetical protein